MYRGSSYSFTMKNLIKNHSLNFPFRIFMQFLLAPQKYVICVIDDMYLTILQVQGRKSVLSGAIKPLFKKRFSRLLDPRLLIE